MIVWVMTIAMAAGPSDGEASGSAEAKAPSEAGAPSEATVPKVAPANLEDLEHWTRGADALLDGPPGCWEVVGRATWAYDFGQFAENRGDAQFVGRLEDGVWTGFTILPLGEVGRLGKQPEKRTYPAEQRFLPLLGQVGEGSVDASTGETGITTTASEGSDPQNVLREVLDELGGDTEVAWTEWDPRVGVLLHRASPVGGGKNPPEAKTTVRFPVGSAVPDAMNVDFPESFHTRGLPRARIRDFEVRVRARVVDGHAFPSREAWRFKATVLGFSGSGAQTITYQHVNACAG
jgi:hypothetical protein